MLHSLALLFCHRLSVLSVGEGKPFARIEEAVKVAQAGDEIDVYPRAGGYLGTAVMVRTPGLSIVGMGHGVLLKGDGFEYSGVGSTPRAIFQIEPSASGVTVENFELVGAHNRSYNGAGVRVNAARRFTLRGCDIHGNDMGVMSNGVDGDLHAGEEQLIDHCHIHANGNMADPGFNHNLYLGGTSVTVQFCRIDHALTGHNLKSRAHFTLVQYCEIFSSANRELDFVEAWDTRRAHSNAVLLGNVISKDPECKGNRVTIQFGQENGRRDGTIYLLYNTVKTPFHSAVLSLTSSSAEARMVDNVIENFSEAHPVLVDASNGSLLGNVAGSCNVVSAAYDVTGTLLDRSSLYAVPGDGRLTFLPVAAGYLDGSGKRVAVHPTHRLSATRGWVEVKTPSVGAVEIY